MPPLRRSLKRCRMPRPKRNERIGFVSSIKNAPIKNHHMCYPTPLLGACISSETEWLILVVPNLAQLNPQQANGNTKRRQLLLCVSRWLYVVCCVWGDVPSLQSERRIEAPGLGNLTALGKSCTRLSSVYIPPGHIQHWVPGKDVRTYVGTNYVRMGNHVWLPALLSV